MTPDAALKKQIERYREMTGEQRLGIAFDLRELACEIARAGIRHQYPDAPETEINERLRERLRLAHGL